MVGCWDIVSVVALGIRAMNGYRQSDDSDGCILLCKSRRACIIFYIYYVFHLDFCSCGR